MITHSRENDDAVLVQQINRKAVGIPQDREQRHGRSNTLKTENIEATPRNRTQVERV